MKKRILVTGGSGFIGKNLIDRLIKLNYTHIWTTTSKKENNKDIFNRSWEGKVVLMPQILTEYAIKTISPDIIFHQAAINDTTCEDRDLMFHANYHAPIQLFQTAYAYGCRKFVYASTTAIYGDSPAPFVEDETPVKPLNCYAESKASFENFINNFVSHHEIETMVGLRYCNVYGPGEGHKGKRMSVIGQLARVMNHDGNPELFKDGTQRRDWLYVDDAVNANIKAMDFKGSNIFNCGSGTATSFNRIVEILNQELGKNLETKYINNPFAAKYQNYTECDMNKAKDILKFEPQYDIIKGIKTYLEKGLN